MVRLIAALVGLVFCVALLWGAVQPRDAVIPDPVKKYYREPEPVAFSFNNPVTGTFDRAQLQRGFQVYKEVCSGCHSLNRIAFRNLTDIGFSVPEVKAIAKGYDIPSIDATGEPATRKGLPSDHFYGPYPNETAARAANNNALPPDFSLLAKAREHGPHYIHALLTGYRDAPKDWQVPEGLYYNIHFHSLNIAMPPPLQPDQVTYVDGTKASVDQMAKDVAAFMMWTAEPKLEARRRTGVGVIIFLIILTGLAYLSYHRVWADVKGKKTATPAT
jgi:ubiquinol-cytochrome c reductase cytochrome c1 subunit